MAPQRDQLVIGEPCASGQPLRVTAHVRESLTFRHPIMLDGLLAWVVAARERLLPPMPGEEPATIEIPIQREPGGRFHLCSQAIVHSDGSDLRYKNRRAPWHEYARLGSGKIRRCDISAGLNKGFRIPYSLTLPRGGDVSWYCIGDPERVADLLRDVHYLGKHRGSGKGLLDIHGQPWKVEECETWGDGFPVVSADGEPMRPLPLDWTGSGQQSFRVLTYPYFDRTREEMLLCPR